MRRFLGLVLVLALLMAACSDDSGSSSEGRSGESNGASNGSESDGDGDGAVPATDSVWLTDLLALVPDTGSNAGQIIANDYTLARSGSGIDLPDEGASDDEIGRYRVEMTVEPPGPQTAPTESTGVNSIGDVQASREEIGFTFEDVDRDILAGDLPDIVEVIQGSIDRSTVEDAVTADPIWSDELEQAEAGGTEYFTWLDDGELRIDLRSPLRQIGNSLRLAVEDDTAYVTRTTSTMEAALEDGPRLADDPSIAAVATALQEAGAHSVLLTDSPPSASSARLEGIPTDAPDEIVDELLGDGEAFTPAAVLGTGIGYLDGEQTFIEVVAYGNDEDAEVNAERLESLVADGVSLVRRQPWNEVLTPESIETRDGLIIAVFTTERPQLWREALFQADNIVAFG